MSDTKYMQTITLINIRLRRFGREMPISAHFDDFFFGGGEFDP